VLRPLVGETVRLRSGTLRGPSLTVRVQPQLTLRRRGAALLVQVHAGRPYTGRTIVLQTLRGGRWQAVQHAQLDAHGRAELRPSLRHAQARVVVGPAPGYVAAASEPLRLP
jgi:hypothetical protein